MTVKLKYSVVQSEHVCQKLAILLHQMADVLHFWTLTKHMFAEETGREGWVSKQSVIRGGLQWYL